MVLNIEFLNELAKVPVRAHETDFCFDCYATSCEEIAPNVYKYGLGFRYEFGDVNPINAFVEKEKDGYDAGFYLPKDNYRIGVSVRPRYSIWKHGMVLANTPGTLNENYRGEVCAIFYHVMPNMQKYEVGERVCQIHFELIPNMEINVINGISVQTDRGEGGFGSSGSDEITTIPQEQQQTFTTNDFSFTGVNEMKHVVTTTDTSESRYYNGTGDNITVTDNNVKPTYKQDSKRDDFGVYC